MKTVDINDHPYRGKLPKLAPVGMEYLCGACGRRSYDRYVGDTSCVTWYCLVYEGTSDAVSVEDFETSIPRG